jgi:hypothetical protein
MVVQLKDSFAQYELLDKVITYIKDKNVNLNNFILVLLNIVSCVRLQLP